jgi:CubicO group peptidase (beta-lactamase class C family)
MNIKQVLRLMISVYVLLFLFGISKAGNPNMNYSSSSQHFDTLKLIDDYLSELEKNKNFSGGLLIIKGNKKLFCKGYGWANKEKNIKYSATTLSSIGSITKAFTATAIMKLVEQKKLSLQDQLIKFFPSVPKDKATITIHQLLTHAAGFHEFLKADAGDYEILNTKDFLNRAFNEPLAFEPGTKAVYTNVGYSLLGIIIESITGVEYELFLKNEVLNPIGIKGIGYHFPELISDTIAQGYIKKILWGTHQQRFAKANGGPYWNLKANGGLEASLNDIFLWANSFTNKTILSDSSIDKMFYPHITEDGTDNQYYFGYGCNIAKSRRNTKLIDNGGSNGIYYARMLRLPEEELVFYMVTNESSVNCNMVLPNVTQLYFYGLIEQDAMNVTRSFENEISSKIYNLMNNNPTANLANELQKEKIEVQDDMILLEVGQRFFDEGKLELALKLYDFYNLNFPNIIIAWNDKGDILQLLSRKEEAIKCYKKALELKPENQRAKDALDNLQK